MTWEYSRHSSFSRWSVTLWTVEHVLYCRILVVLFNASIIRTWFVWNTFLGTPNRFAMEDLISIDEILNTKRNGSITHKPAQFNGSSSVIASRNKPLFCTLLNICCRSHVLNVLVLCICVCVMVRMCVGTYPALGT